MATATETAETITFSVKPPLMASFESMETRTETASLNCWTLRTFVERLGWNRAILSSPATLMLTLTVPSGSSTLPHFEEILEVLAQRR